jgi:hypothetical protein
MLATQTSDVPGDATSRKRSITWAVPTRLMAKMSLALA